VEEPVQQADGGGVLGQEPAPGLEGPVAGAVRELREGMVSLHPAVAAVPDGFPALVPALPEPEPCPFTGSARLRLGSS